MDLSSLAMVIIERVWSEGLTTAMAITATGTAVDEEPIRRVVISGSASRKSQDDHSTLMYARYVRPENPLQLVRDNVGSHFIFDHYLSSFSSEENVRFLLALAASHCSTGTQVFESAEDLRTVATVLRSATTLGFQCEMHSAGATVHLAISAGRNSPESLYSEEHHFEHLIGFRPQQVSADDALELATAKLSKGEGFSLIRYNHCEPRVFGYRTAYSDRDLDVTFDIQWGHTDVSKAVRASVAHLVAEALVNTDIVGVPKFNKQLKTKLEILENSFYTISAQHGYLNSSMKFTDVNCHMALGRSAPFFEMIAQAERVVLVTGREVQTQLAKKTGNTGITTILLPQEARFTVGSGTSHRFPEAYPYFVEQIRKVTSPGTLVLVGGGILGKHFCNVAKQCGGVALDLGSLFDAWAGIQSRGAGFSPELRL